MFFNLYVLLFCTLIVHIRYSKKLKFSSNFKFSTMIEQFIKIRRRKKKFFHDFASQSSPNFHEYTRLKNTLYSEMVVSPSSATPDKINLATRPFNVTGFPPP